MDTWVIVGLVLLGVYIVDCWVFHTVDHRTCKGTGWLKSPWPWSSGKRPCWCDGGKRRKLGARLMGRG